MSLTGHPRLRRALRTMIFAIPALLLAGCVQQTSNGSEITFRYELWVTLGVLLLGIVAVPAGWFLRKLSARFGWALLILGPIATLLIAPSMFGDRVVVDDEGFRVRVGIWSTTAVHDVKFDDLSMLKITAEVTRGRRKQTHLYFVCERKSGGAAKVPMNGELTKAAAHMIFERVHVRGIPIVDET
jgi:hypothetical protein